MSRLSMPTVIQADLLVDSRCTLGEGIVWCERAQVAWWTDIESSRLWRWHQGEGKARSWRLPGRLGSLALCESGRLLLGMADGLYLLDVSDVETVDSLRPEPLGEVSLPTGRVRLNDGRCDRAGNFVFGTMDEDAGRQRLGRFYQYSPEGGLRLLALEGVAIANSLCFGLDGASMYYCDSPQGRIMRCSYRAETASVGKAEVFAEVDPPATPDGAAIDREGRLWSAQWGGGRVTCHGQDGRIESIVELPVTNVSCPAFGGPLLDQLLVTTARKELDEAGLLRQPQAGGVYQAVIAGAVGLPEARFRDQ